MDIKKALVSIGRTWDESILPELMDYVRIPNKSPAFDPEWDAHGHMEAAVQLMRRWAEAHALPGTRIEVLRLPGRTPLLMLDVPGQVDDCVLMYGHLDKQPEFTGWSDGLDPWTPVLRDGKLYGRGGADDGYALFASLTALRTLHEQGVPHARAVILIEASEESGSPDLEHHIEALGDRLGTPSLVVCLDAECGNYDQLWATTSLRGNLIATLRVDVLTEGVHSGTASGIVPSSFRVLREILARVEDASSGAILIEELNTAIPPDRRAQARAAAGVLGNTVFEKFPLPPGMRTVSNDPYELLLNNTWRPTLSVTGADGLPESRSAGNVLRPSHHAEAVVPAAADAGRRSRVGSRSQCARARPSLRRGRQRPDRIGDGGVERARGRPLARAVDAAGLARVLRPRRDVHGNRREHPVHGHARAAFPGHAVPHHRPAGAEVERPRPERIPAHRDRQAPDGLRGAGAGGSRPQVGR